SHLAHVAGHLPDELRQPVDGEAWAAFALALHLRLFRPLVALAELQILVGLIDVGLFALARPLVSLERGGDDIPALMGISTVFRRRAIRVCAIRFVGVVVLCHQPPIHPPLPCGSRMAIFTSVGSTLAKRFIMMP